MANDLISNYDLIGKSLSQIEELLGKPDNDCKYENCRMSYNLGPCRGFGISYGVLIIELKEWKAIEVYKNCH
jgi:hypothetical protein